MSQNLGKRLWQLLLMIHITCYIVFLVITIHRFNYFLNITHSNLLILLFWMAILLIHTGIHYYSVGRGSISHLERQAYREGIADALRQLGQRGETVERLMLDDEGELLEPLGKRKR